MNIIVQKHGKGFKAFFRDQPDIWEAGDTGAEAIGKLIVTRQELHDLKISYVETNESVPAPQPLPFTDRIHNFEFFYQPHGEYGNIKVGITGDCYDREIDYIKFLLKNLRDAIPFSFDEFSQPRIEILAGRRINGQILVEMVINVTEPGMDQTLAIWALASGKFVKGFGLVR